MTENYINLVNQTVLGTSQCNNHHFVSISHEFSQANITMLNCLPNYQPKILGGHTMHLLSFQLCDDSGNASENNLEIFLTETIQTATAESNQKQDEHETDRIIFVIAPRIWWNRQHFEMFPQFSLVVYDRHQEPMSMAIDEVQHKVKQNLHRPINRLHNSTNMFCKIFADKIVHLKVLAFLRPEDVGRMELASVSLRNTLLTESVDNAFWKLHYERQFGKVQDNQKLSYRERYADRVRWQKKAARMMSIPLLTQSPTDVPEEPKPINPFLPYYPSPAGPEIDDDPLRIGPILPVAPHAPSRPRPTQPSEPPMRPQPTGPARPPYQPPMNPYPGYPYGPSQIKPGSYGGDNDSDTEPTNPSDDPNGRGGVGPNIDLRFEGPGSSGAGGFGGGLL